MLPARQRLDAIEPGGDVLVLGRDVEAELLGRIIHVGDQRQVRDGRPRPEHEIARRQPLVDDRQIAVDPPLEEGEHGRVAGRPGEKAQEPVGPEIAVDLLIVEDDPAQRLEPLVLALRRKLAGVLRQIGQDDARLAELAGAMHQHRHLAHLVDVGPVVGRALLALDEKVDPDRLPVGADEIEHQGDPIGIAGLGEAVELVLGHVMLPRCRRGHFMVGMMNSAPSLVPEGQRAVTVLVLV